MLLSSPACSTFSSLLLVLTHKTKKCLHYTLNTLHQTLYDTLIIHSKHAICLKSLNSQNSPSLLLSLSTVCISHRPSHSFPRSSATKSSDLSYNFFDWLVWCLFPPTGTCFFFFLLANTSCLQTLSREQPVIITSSCTKRAANATAMLAKKPGRQYLS